jgi:hypothetical protein
MDEESLYARSPLMVLRRRFGVRRQSEAATALWIDGLDGLD